MSREYIVIPEGTTLLLVNASSPEFALNKVERGKGEWLDIETRGWVLPRKAMMKPKRPPRVIPGQLSIEDA